MFLWVFKKFNIKLDKLDKMDKMDKMDKLIRQNIKYNEKYLVGVSKTSHTTGNS